MRNLLLLLLMSATFACEQPPRTDASANKITTEIKQPNMFPAVQTYMDSLVAEFELIPEERKTALKQMAAFIKAQKDSAHPVELTFICTHNSRRSHLGQIWASAAASFYKVEGVTTYSGGTEATAFNPRAVAAMERAGFVIENPGGNNPRYRVHLAEGDAGLVCFSKKYDDIANPQKDFAAIMTCSQADAECPFIPGAKFRLSLPYNDPKEADGKPEETARYDERCRQIGREMMYAFATL